MSIAVPFNRLGASTAGHVSRVSRSSSWLNRPTEVGKDVRALFQVFDGSRSPSTSISATDFGSHAGDSHASTSKATLLSNETKVDVTKIDRKGKGRADPARDVSADGTRQYVEEGSIPRPTSTFFSINSHQGRTTGFSPIASTSVSKFAPDVVESAQTATYQSAHRHADQRFPDGYTLPASIPEAARVVSYIASSANSLSDIETLLDRVRGYPTQVEIAALSSCLAHPVQTRRVHWRSGHEDGSHASHRAPSNDSRLVLNGTTFNRIWTRLWDLAGDRLQLPPHIASRTLRNIFATSSLQGSDIRPELSRSGKLLRHLLFLAGLEEHPTLAVNVLAHLLRPTSHNTASTDGPAVSESQKSDLSTSLPSADVNDLVLILQDLLRSGIFSPSTVNRFGLSEVLSKAPALDTQAFEGLLKQTLLRIVLQYYVDHGEVPYISNILEGFQPISKTGSTELHVNQERDASLLFDSAKALYRHFRYDTLQAGSVAKNLALLVETIPDAVLDVGMASGDPLPSLGSIHRLLHNYFSLVLEVSPEEEHVIWADDLARLWRAVVHKGLEGVSRTPLLDPLSEARLLGLLARSEGISSQDVILHIAQRLARYLSRSSSPSTYISNELANKAIEAMAAAARASTSARSAIAEMVFTTYDNLLHTEKAFDSFSLSAAVLRPLADLARHAPTESMPAEAPTPSSSSIIDHFMRTRAAWKVIPHADFTALAGALLDNGEHEASRQVLQQMFSAKKVPTLEDVEICLRVLAKEQPDSARSILQDAVEEGLLVVPDID